MELFIRPIGLSGPSRFICRSCRQHLRKQRRSYASTATKTPELYDVVCVGGGPAGLSLLTALRTTPSITSPYISTYPPHLTNLSRLQPHNRTPQNRPRRKPTSRPNTHLVPPPIHLLQPLQFPHSRLRRLPPRHRSMAPHRRLPPCALRRNASLGRHHRFTDLLRLAPVSGDFQNHSLYDRKSQPDIRPAETPR